MNNNKTKIFFSRNVHHTHAKQRSDELGYTATEDLGKFLGIPLIHKRVSKGTFSYLIDKSASKLSAWKARTLSFAGGLTPSKSALEAIPSYAMQRTSMPVSVCNQLEKNSRNFLWGSHTNSRKVHAVKWTEVCKPKTCGGLGLRHLDTSNQAYIMKVGWGLIQKKDDLWG